MTKTDPNLTQIAAQFTRFDIEPNRGGYTLLDRRSANPVARLRPIPDTDRFELFYMSNLKGRMKSCSRAHTRSSRMIRCSAFRAGDEPNKIWPKSS